MGSGQLAWLVCGGRGGSLRGDAQQPQTDLVNDGAQSCRRAGRPVSRKDGVLLQGPCLGVPAYAEACSSVSTGESGAPSSPGWGRGEGYTWALPRILSSTWSSGPQPCLRWVLCQYRLGSFSVMPLFPQLPLSLNTSLFI